MFDRLSYNKQHDQDAAAHVLPPASPVGHQVGFNGNSTHSRLKVNVGRHSNSRSSGIRLTAENALSNSIPLATPPSKNPIMPSQSFSKAEPAKKDVNFLVDINQRDGATAQMQMLGRDLEKMGSRKGTASGRRQLGDGNNYLRNNFNRGLNMTNAPTSATNLGQTAARNAKPVTQKVATTVQRQNTSSRGSRSSKLPLIQTTGMPPSASKGSLSSTANASGRGELHIVYDATPNSGACSITGLKPDQPNWINQDSFIALEQRGANGGDDAMFGVLDGHGQQGHLVSQRCRERIPQLFRETGNNLSQTCLRMQAELEKTGIDIKCSGATCVICVKQGRTLMVGNLGDSKCVLGRRTNGIIIPQPLTTDHKPDRPDERQRILQAGGKVGCRQLVVGNGPNGPVRLPMGPMRIWYQVRGETMGLAMSRSLGDSIVHTQGVSADPEITEHMIDGDDVFIMLGSDGIWDVTDLNQAVQIVQSVINKNPHGWDPKEAAELLATSARRRWESMSQMIDDITAIVVKL